MAIRLCSSGDYIPEKKLRVKLFEWLGVEADMAGHREKLIAGFGAFTGIAVVFAISRNFAGGWTGR